MLHNEPRHKAGVVYAALLTLLFGLAFQIKVPLAPPDLATPVPAPSRTDVPTHEISLPDFAAIRDVEKKKETFFNFLQPYIDAQNAAVLQQRRHLTGVIGKITDGMMLEEADLGFLSQLSEEYAVPTEDLEAPAFLKLLLRRVDVLPPSLVLAQAANESAWGTSRFAQEGYNLFGQWCYTQGCGLVPNRRRSTASHEVKSFDSIADAVQAYFQNLNTFPSYQYLRLIRQDLRAKQQPIDGISLSGGLQSYSERGDAYVNELRSMIYHNDLLFRDSTTIQ